MASDPQYFKRRVTLPIVKVAASKDVDQPRLGPWPLKRSFSTNGTSKLKILQESINNPDLSHFLAKIDEECAAFEAIGANHDVCLDEKISSTDPALSQIKVVVREEGRQTKTKAGNLACDTLFTIMVVCAIIVLAIPPILTHTFADPASAKIVLPKAVPSLTVLGTILGLYTFATGVAFAIAVASVGTIRRRKGFLPRRRTEVLLFASVASLVGLLHVGWVALWIVPVCRHA